MIAPTADEMRRMDALAIERFGIPAATLMENAGRGAAEILLARFPHVRRRGVLIVTGKGNNGGDGFVLASALKRRRVRCEVVLAASTDQIEQPARQKLLAWKRAGGKTSLVTADTLGALERGLARCGCVVDALFGTGIKGEVRGLAAELIALVNASGLPTVALDIPSGLDADRGVPLGIAIQAELTVAFAAPKLGTLIFPGARYAGELAVVDIGIPDEAVTAVAPRAEAVTAIDAVRLLQPRDLEAHKGHHGHLAVIAGGRGKTGAAVLVGRAAARAGAGLVTVGCPDSQQPIVAAGLIEEMTWPLPDDGRGGLTFATAEAYSAFIAGKQALVIGPGIGVSEERRALVKWLIEDAPLPIVVDADALNCLGNLTEKAITRPQHPLRILTPHPGEMARLAGTSTAEVQNNRLDMARRLAAASGCIVILKGARTVTADPNGRLWINLSGNPGLAAGGTGDVLAGIVGGLLAQGYPEDEAARLGVFLHGWAADRLATRRSMVGMIASDLIEELPAATAVLFDQLGQV